MSILELLVGELDPKRVHESSIEKIIRHPKMAELKPVSVRTLTRLTDKCLHLSSEGFGKSDPHTLLLLRSPKYRDQWILYSMCPRSASGTTSYKIKAEEAEAIRIASVVTDIALGIIEAQEWMKEDGDEEDDIGEHFRITITKE
jgi:hypothetical protein